MTRRIFTTSAILLGAFAVSASAQDYSAGGGLSIFGPTLQGTYSVSPNIAVRGIGFIPIRTSLNSTEIDDGYRLDGEIDTGAVAVLADYYPTGQGWRLSGGLFFAPDELLTGTFTGPETFNGALIMDRSVAPIFTGGYQHDFHSGWYVTGEVGAIFSGFVVESDSIDASVIADIDDINDDLDDISAFPYVAVSVGFAF